LKISEIKPKTQYYYKKKNELEPTSKEASRRTRNSDVIEQNQLVNYFSSFDLRLGQQMA
jgi:hypothetical protein